MEQLYQERMTRYVTALRNGKPDKIPIRPFVAEFTAKYAGYTCQEVTYDYEKAFIAARKCAADFDWDAIVPNMVHVWAGLTEAIGLKYYAIPGVHVPEDTCFQFVEPAEDDAFMKPDEYDALIDDPTGFLLDVWLPRVSRELNAVGEPTTTRNNLSFLKGGMAMMQYFSAYGPQIDLMKTESGTVSAIAGILKAPMDIIADKLRGYLGLLSDLQQRPEKLKAACEALIPHLFHMALSTSDPDKNVPVTVWMHRGGVPFVGPEAFDNIYWPTLKPLIEALWAEGIQTLCYAEGDWNYHLKSFAELPDQSIIYHADRGDIFEIHKVLGEKFCLSGGVPNTLLSYGSTEDVRECCKKIIDGVAKDGGYIMDASAILQNDARVENVRAMTEFTREYGVYNGAAASVPALAQSSQIVQSVKAPENAKRKPGVCIPWQEKMNELPKLSGDTDLVKTTWEAGDELAYAYIWHCLLSY